ncbi:YgiT-type zinc finger protein [Clostridium sp. Cult2]|uniref:YgiT-type zinc finger protein n=1 Tax=Clostridium sp. Cult2 TaxID=2079003 RepID=UPI001F39DF39|nr:YgiT-type zinc finger protein [Clostridium sp. Cult2]
MNCALCKGKLKKGIVNHIIDLGDGIIIIKNVVEELRKNKAEVLIINYNEMVA